MKEYYTFTIVAGDHSCMNSCPFCISKMTPKIPYLYSPREFNYFKFQKAIRIAEKYNANNVLITGKGEPTLFPQEITDILVFLKGSSFARIELQTDGFTLLSIMKKNKWSSYLKKWKSLGLDMIAISTYHYITEKNKKIFKSKHVMDLDAMINAYKIIHGFDIRLSCVLLKGYIDSIEEVKKMIAFAKERNIMQLTFRKLGISRVWGISDKLVNAYNKYASLKVSDSDIIKFFDRYGKLIDVLPHGARIYEYKQQNVCLTDCLSEDYGKEKVRQLIFHPNGWLCTSWEFPYGSRIL